MLTFISVLSFVNIGFYIFSIYMSESNFVLKKIEDYEFLKKFLNYYKKSRIGFIIFEVILFLFCQGCITIMCFQVLGSY